MNPLIIVNFNHDYEYDSIVKLQKKFGNNLRVITKNPNIQNSWVFESMDKNTVDWTRRFLKNFVKESLFDSLIKIDPDTNINGNTMPLPNVACDIAGDFRKSNLGWIWFGAYQYFTIKSAQKILDDIYYTGYCIFQDIELSKVSARQGLIAYNMFEINGWDYDNNSDAIITHRGKNIIPRQKIGYINWDK